MSTILVIDAEPTHVEQLAVALEDRGHQVHYAADRGTVFHRLDATPPDLIIIDPDSLPLDGLQFCRQLRNLNPHWPMLVVSRLGQETDILDALAAGIDDYLVKPVSGQLLLARIEALLRRLEERHSYGERQFATMRRSLDEAWQVPLKPTLRSPYPELVRSLAGSLGATYCRFAVREGSGRLRIKASAGYRPRLDEVDDRSFTVATLPHAAEALAHRRSVIVDLAVPDPKEDAEREQLFSRLTRSAALIPFNSDRVDGLLIVGEERQARHEPFSGEHLAMLEYVAHRVGDMLRMNDLVRRVRVAERRRQLLAVKRIERARLARELHDEVGQSLSGLLIRLRLARSEGSLSLADIGALEDAAQNALDAARSVAYDLRRQSGATDTFNDARAFAEQVLDGAGCRLTWIDRRHDGAIDVRSARTAARVIKESVTNVVRHAGAHATEVKLEQADGRLRVTVQDDGNGFVPASVMLNRNGRGLGLLGNRERLEQVGGSYVVESFPGAGTSVVFEIPLRRRLAVARAG